jgi:hypothetical protein
VDARCKRLNIAVEGNKDMCITKHSLRGELPVSHRTEKGPSLASQCGTCGGDHSGTGTGFCLYTLIFSSKCHSTNALCAYFIHLSQTPYILSHCQCRWTEDCVSPSLSLSLSLALCLSVAKSCLYGQSNLYSRHNSVAAIEISISLGSYSLP